jgi:hypothetical protein
MPDQAPGRRVRRVVAPLFEVDAFGADDVAVDGFATDAFGFDVAARRVVEPARAVFGPAVVRRRPVAVGADVAAVAAAAEVGEAAAGVVEAAAVAAVARPRAVRVVRDPVLGRPRVVLPRGRPGPRRGLAAADSCAWKNSSAVRVFVCWAPPTSTPSLLRYERASAATWKVSAGRHFVDSSRIREPSW